MPYFINRELLLKYQQFLVKRKSLYFHGKEEDVKNIFRKEELAGQVKIMKEAKIIILARFFIYICAILPYAHQEAFKFWKSAQDSFQSFYEFTRRPSKGYKIYHA